MIRLRKPLQALLPCLGAFSLLGIYVLELSGGLNLPAVNLVCLLLAGLELFSGAVSPVNTRKAGAFASSLAIALAALAVNLRGELPLSGVSVWQLIWALLAAASAVCLAAVLIRLMRWSQEQWEEIQRESRALREERLEERRRSRREQRQMGYDRERAWRDQRREQTRREIDARNRQQEEELESRREERLLKRGRRAAEKRMKMANNMGENRRLKAWAAGLTAAVVALYFLLPYILRISFVHQWGEAIVSLGKSIAGAMANFADSNGVEEAAKADPVQGVAYYTLFYIALLGIVYVAFILLYRAIVKVIEFIHGGEHRGPQGDSIGFFDEYGTALSVFIVSMAVLLVTTGRFEWSDTGNLFLQMLYAIFAVIIILIGIDIVRLTLRQCLESGSFLRNNMELTFILVVENVMGTVLSVLMSLWLKNMLESILLFLFYNHKSNAHRKVEEVLEQSMDREIEAVRDRDKKRHDRQRSACGRTSRQGERPAFKGLRIRRWKK